MIVAVDFDGTMVDHAYPNIGRSAPHAIRVVKRMIDVGYNVILWTMRDDEELDQAINYMRKNEIELFGVNVNPEQHEWTSSPKAYANVYIDDAALGCPLIKPIGFNRVAVDWLIVELHIFGDNEK